MASFRKTSSGSWEAQVARQGVRKSASFPTKAMAQAWATRIEAEIMAGARGQIPDKTFADLLQRYEEEVA